MDHFFQKARGKPPFSKPARLNELEVRTFPCAAWLEGVSHSATLKSRFKAIDFLSEKDRCRPKG